MVVKLYKLGIDIGASHIGLGIYDENLKMLIKKNSIPYTAPSFFYKFRKKRWTYKYILLLQTYIDDFIEGYPIESIGIGCPGGVDTKDMIFYGSSTLGVGRIDFKEALWKYQVPISIDNDCNCAAVGEAMFHSQCEFLMITIGTGVGFSLVKKEKEKIFLSKDETIWKILEINKPPKTRHSKYVVSFKRLAKRYSKHLPREAIFEHFECSKELIYEYISSFAKGIRCISQDIPIKDICIGGSFSNYHSYYLPEMKKSLPEFTVFIAKNYNDSGILGATQLPIDRYDPVTK